MTTLLTPEQRRAAWYSRPEVRERTVIEAAFLRGAGVEGDPVRRVIAYFEPDGTLLAERDEWAEQRPPEDAA
jgi:hypothetical protein